MDLSLKNKLLDSFSTGIIVFNPKKSNDFIEGLNSSAIKALSLDKESLNGDLIQSNPNLAKLFSELREGSLSLNYRNKKRIELRTNGKTFNVFITLLEDQQYLLELCEYMSKDIGKTTHELKRPIQNIKSLTESLIMGAKDDAAICDKFLKNIDNEVDRLGILVDNILQLSSLESSSIELKRSSIALDKVVEDVIASLQGEAKKKNVSINIDQEAPCSLEADGALLKHLLENLIENAIKYNKVEGAVFVEINSNSLSIKDTGIGIPEADKDAIFEQFYRASNSSVSQGSGLGLSIVKKIVDLHGWGIQIESQEGEGTKFIVKF